MQRGRTRGLAYRNTKEGQRLDRQRDREIQTKKQRGSTIDRHRDRETRTHTHTERLEDRQTHGQRHKGTERWPQGLTSTGPVGKPRRFTLNCILLNGKSFICFSRLRSASCGCRRLHGWPHQPPLGLIPFC